MFNQVVPFVRIYAALHGEGVLTPLPQIEAVILAGGRTGILSPIIFQ